MLSKTEFDPARFARRMLREARTGALATLLPSGAPHASLVTVANLADGSPVLLLSRLARHTENILADPRVSLLIEGPRAGDPLAGARVSIAGTIATTDNPAARRRFLARHSSAAGYAGFKDFAFWRIEMTGAHLVAGFGRIVDLSAADLSTEVADAAEVLAAEESAIEHMNADHADAIERYATRLLGAEAGPWRVMGIDPAGCDLFLGETIRRLEFPQRVMTADALRKMLAELARQARDT
ncbi:MAG: HugZ family protein [Bradyrhizobiaceae bacterium]|nr:HugZ family protein [Bradyrhizobiaceae bacterium]